MRVQLYIAHSGQRLHVDGSRFHDLGELKSWISHQIETPSQRIILLTQQGRNVKAQSLWEENIICVYDIRVSRSSSPASSVTALHPIPKPRPSPSPPSSTKGNSTQFSAIVWKDLAQSYSQYASDVLRDARQLHQDISSCYGEIDVIAICLEAAMSNIENSIKQIQPRYVELKQWLAPAIKEDDRLIQHIDTYLAIADTLPISPKMAAFMTRNRIGTNSSSTIYLRSLLDEQSTISACQNAPKLQSQVATKASQLHDVGDKLFHNLQLLISSFEKFTSRSAFVHNGETPALVRECETLVESANDICRKITFSLSTLTASDLAQRAYSLLQEFDNSITPRFNELLLELNTDLQYAIKERNELANSSVQIMRRIAELSALHSNLKSLVTDLSSVGDEDTAIFEYLRLIHHLPFVYASFMSEAIRRREWAEKVRNDSSSIANAMAFFQEEETKRQKKWQKTVGTAFGPTNPEMSVLSFEVSIRLDTTDKWPVVEMNELEEFVQQLSLQQDADESIVKNVVKVVDDLKSPNRHSSKRARAFKNGSVQDASLGISGLLLRADEDLVQALREDNSKLENKLKTSESRIRRLEDLLHRQNQPLTRLYLSPSFRTRQIEESHNQVKESLQEEPSVGQKHEIGNEELISHLEGLLRDEKDRTQLLQTSENELKQQLEEAETAKADLLGNMEAMRREFVEERKLLELQIKKLQARVEETEDEIEHFGESREHEKAVYVDKLQQAHEKLNDYETARQLERDTMQDQIGLLQKESQYVRDRNKSLLSQVQQLQGKVRSLNKTVDSYEETAKIHHATLVELLEQFSQFPPSKGRSTSPKHIGHSPTDLITRRAEPQKAGSEHADNRVDSPKPLDTAVVGIEVVNSTTISPSLAENTELLNQVLVRLSEAANRCYIHDNDSRLLQADFEQEQAVTRDLRAQISEKSQLALESENALKKLQAALEKERERSIVLEGEVGKVLQQHRDEHDVENKEHVSLEEKSASANNEPERGATGFTTYQTNSARLSNDLHDLYNENQELHTTILSLEQHLQGRAERSKEISQHLFTCFSRLTKLLERLGYQIVSDSGTMRVNRLPRSERSTLMQSASDNNPNNTFDTTPNTFPQNELSGSPQHGLPQSSLYWIVSNGDEKTEAEQFCKFIETLGGFDVDVFTDTIYRRIKEVEHLARRFQRDARTYRDRSHSLQKEAHQKLAYRNFKEGDLALFLPTRNQKRGAWAAFNMGSPHYFLREQDSHRLYNREWLVARITRIRERVVDLSKIEAKKTANRQPPTGVNQFTSKRGSNGDGKDGEEEEENPFDLSDGLRWYLIDAHEYKIGAAPATPGTTTSTVKESKIDAIAVRHRSSTSIGSAVEASQCIGGNTESRSPTLQPVTPTRPDRISNASPSSTTPIVHDKGIAIPASSTHRLNEGGNGDASSSLQAIMAAVLNKSSKTSP